MKKILSAMVLVGLVVTTGCTETPNQQKADAVRDQAKDKAKEIRAEHNDAAESVRESTGKTITGSARTNTAENRADQLEKDGANKAKAVENAGEARADQIEKNDANRPR